MRVKQCCLPVDGYGMTRHLRARLGTGAMALTCLWLAGAADADTGWGPIWFPLTTDTWMDHTLGTGRTVELWTDGTTVSWQVKFVAQSDSTFHMLEGTIPLDAPNHCDDLGVFVEGEVLGDRSTFRPLELGRYSWRDPPAREELGAVQDRLRSSGAPGFPLPRRQVWGYMEHSEMEDCEKLRSTCVEGKTPVFPQGAPPTGYSIAVAVLPQQVRCEEVDSHVDRCLEHVRLVDVAYTEGLERYEKSLGCFAVAFVTRADDGEAVELEVLSAAGKSWGSARAEIDERVHVSAWAYLPLTVVFDIPFMAIWNTTIGLMSFGAVFQ